MFQVWECLRGRRHHPKHCVEGTAGTGACARRKQAGTYVARVLKSKIAARLSPPPFKYRHLGNLATIGRKAAVADFGFVKLWGAPAWWLWGIVHVGFLVGMRNRVATMINWFWAYLVCVFFVALLGTQPRSDAQFRHFSLKRGDLLVTLRNGYRHIPGFGTLRNVLGAIDIPCSYRKEDYYRLGRAR